MLHLGGIQMRNYAKMHIDDDMPEKAIDFIQRSRLVAEIYQQIDAEKQYKIVEIIPESDQ